MLSVTILLAILLLAINIGNICVSERQSRQMIDILLEEETMLQPLPGGDKPKGFLDAPTDANSRMSAVYFTVRAGGSRNVFQINTSRMADMTEKEAEEIYQEAMEEGTVEGKIDKFLYKVSINERDGSSVCLFLDTTVQFHGILRVMFFSVAAGTACWLAMLLFVTLISKRAIRPIAENIERQKQFVTDAGHEIKTPLAIIMANTEAMELYEGENKWSRNIREQIVRLNGLMENLLMLAKDEESRNTTKRSNVMLSSEVVKGTEMFKASFELKGLEVKSQIDADIYVKGDRQQLKRLIPILLDNAVKYSPPGGKIDVSLKKHGKTAIFSIRNQCENLPECPPEKLFDRFYRGDEARTQGEGGYGIGLSSAKTIVGLHKGKITAAYYPPDEIEFTVTL